MKIKYIFFLTLFVLCLSGCTKTVKVDNNNLGEIEESSVTVVESSEAFTVEDPNFELPTKSSEEIQKELDAKIEKEKESLEVDIDKEEQKYFVSDNKLNKEVDIRVIEDEEVSKIIDDIKLRKYSSLNEVNDYVDKKFNEYSDEVKFAVKGHLKETWDFWDTKHMEMDNEKPWTEEELLENPLRRDYTRAEYEKMEQKMKELGQEIGGNGLSEIMSGD